MNELVMYILVNENIRMSKGKAAAQVGHAVASKVFLDSDKNRQALESWFSTGQKKITLKCPQEKLEELEKFGYVSIRDNGHTQLEPNTLTCVNYGIQKRSQVPSWISELRLY